MTSEMNTDVRGFQPPSSMTPREVGDHLARLVWESFSDFVTEGDADALLGDLGLTNEDGVPTDVAAEEVLIFFMWAHTRALQLAFVGRAPDERIREALDRFHAAVFEDMVTHGTPSSQIPLFEQRVSTRYSQYYEAANRSDSEVGVAAARAFATAAGKHDSNGLSEALTRRAVAAADPLRDFLEEVELKA